MDITEAKETLTKELKRRDYSPRTIETYNIWLRRLGEFFPDKEIDLLSFNELDEYLTHLNEGLRIAPSSINQAFHTYNYFFNKILNKQIDFTKIKKPEKKRSNPEVLTPDEVLKIIEGTRNIKHKLLFAITYSAGLELNEARNLKISDVDTNSHQVKVRDRRGRVKKELPLGKYSKTILNQHLDQNNPRKYLFESNRTGIKVIGRTTIRKAFSRQVINQGITKKVSYKTLKYSHIIHLYELGRPMIYTLKDLQMATPHSLFFYSKIINEKIPNKKFSPLDKISLHKEIEHPINREYFEEVIINLKDKEESNYLKEALTCMTAGSLRAGIIFSWNAAILNLRKKCFNHGRETLNSIIKKHDPKGPEIKKEDDFSYIKDSVLLKIAIELGEIDKGEKDSLEDCLDTRNKCGHPSNYRPKTLKAASFMEELINIVFKK